MRQQQTTGLHELITSATLVQTEQRAQVSRLWREIDDHVNGSFFLSSFWIVPWLEALPAGLKILLFKAQDSVGLAAIAILTECRSRWLGLVPLAKLHLHATGVPRFDGLAIEYNGVHARRALEDVAAEALIESLARNCRRWDECELGMVTSGEIFERCARTCGFLVERHSVPAYYVDLAMIRRRGGQFEPLLDKKVRYQLRSSRKAIESRFGALRIESADSEPQRRAFAARLIELHGAHWRERGAGGAFADPWQRAFHEQQISTNDCQSYAQLLRVSAGDTEVGYLYTFIWHGTVYFYQSGYHYDQLGRDANPGYLTIAMAVQSYCDAGLDRFEFMAGNNLYKSKLSTHSGELSSVRVAQPSLKMRTIWLLRRVMRAARRRRVGQ